jgi:hypothetical protein
MTEGLETWKTAYLEFLLLKDTDEKTRLYDIITPSDPNARGAQLNFSDFWRKSAMEV